jgi:ubiquitin C-terminal hydrolase
LCIHIKRLVYDFWRPTRLSNAIDFDLTLDMTAFCSTSLENSFKSKKKQSSDKILYQLTSVVLHQGTSYAGHYTALKKAPKMFDTEDKFEDMVDQVQKGSYGVNGKNDKWYYISDQDSWEVDPKTMVEEFGNNVYMLFYERV